jgi:hypothetical protein
MTTIQLIQMTLRKLDRPIDSGTVALYKERLIGYFNEALMDLSAEFRPWRRDILSVTNGQADLSDLPRTCLKVLAARVNGQRRLFYYGSTRGTILFPGMEDGDVELTYRYLPALLEELTDEPQLPEEIQGLLAEYAAARERSRFDAASQNAARIDLTLYRERKGQLRRSYPTWDLSRIYNIY